MIFVLKLKSTREPLGVIILEGCTVELAEEETDVFAFKVKFVLEMIMMIQKDILQIVFHGEGKTQGRVYVLGTNTMEDLEAWMKLIACASYDYMKLMVVELQHQLAELEERDKLKQSSRPEAPPRNRSNPFNTSHSSKRSWAEIHRAAGQKICSDRQLWRSRVTLSQECQSPSQEASVTMTEDKLLVAF